MSILMPMLAFPILFGAAPARDVPSGTSYNLVWTDEFNTLGSGPNPNNWVFDSGSGGWGNNELQTYVTDVAHCGVVQDPFATDGLALRIQATYDGTTYRSARIKTLGKVQPQYGWVEARLKLPYGQGIWPAFWAMGANGARWPGNGEIDIMENIGNASWSNRVQSALHGTGYSGGSALTSTFYLQSGAFKDDYHLFQMQWSPYSIKFFVNGELYGTKTARDIGSNKWLFNQPFYFLLNLAVGGNWPGSPDATTVFPQSYLIDYVRVHQAPATAKAAVPVVSAAAASSQVNLTLGSTGAESFNVFRSTTSGGQGTTPFATNVSGAWSDTTAKNGTRYYYKATALNYAGETGMTAEVSAVPAAGIATTKTDTLQNFNTVTSKSAGWAIDFSNPTYFDGDSARANRTGDTTQNLIYSYPNISTFSAKVYAWQAPISKVVFAYSTGTNTYTTIPVNYGAKTSNASGWGYYTITPSGALPTGVKSLRVQFVSGTGNGWDPQLSQITINHS